MKKYTKYKPSGVEWIGEIPEGWYCKTVKKNSQVIDGDRGNEYPNENDFVDNGIPFLSTSNIKSNRLVFLNIRFISEEKFKRLGKGKLQNNDLIITVRGTIGATAIFRAVQFPTAFINAQMMIIRPSINLNIEYFNYITLSEYWRLQLDFNSYGTAQQQLTNGILQNIIITHPTLPEQSSIARFLDHKTALIDRITSNRRKQIDLLKEERKAVINKAVTKGINKNTKMKQSGVEWLGEIPEHWDVVKLKHVASYKSGDTLSSEYIQETGEFPVYGGNNIRGFFNQFNHDGFFILIGRQGALCGNINYAKGKFWATEHAVVVYIKKHYETIWLGELLRIMNLNQYSQSAAQPGLAVEMIKNLSIALPPIEEQKEITSHINQKTSKIDTLITKYEKQINLLEEYRTALISKAVTGQIDVRDWQPKAELELMP